MSLQAQPRRLPAYPPSAPSSTTSSRRTSQTFRPSPLAGPVLSYTNLSALDDDPSDVHHQSSSSSSSSLGLSGRPAAHRSASTGALESLDSGRLRPPPPCRQKASRDRVDSSSSKRLSRTSSRSSMHSTTTLSSLMSLTLSETTEALPTPRASGSDKVYSPSSSASLPRSYAFRRHSYGPLGPHALDLYTTESSSSEIPSPRPFVPLNPHSRFSFSPTLSPQSSSGSLRSTASSSASSMSIPKSARASSHGIEIRVEGDDTTSEVLLDNRSRTEIGRAASQEKERRLAPPRSLSPPPTVKHDWLTASPTPVFSRSALRTQGVIMPASARESGRGRGNGDSTNGRSGSVKGKRGVARAPSKKETVAVKESGEIRKADTGTGTKRRASLRRLAFQLRSFISHESASSTTGKPAKSGIENTNTNTNTKPKPKPKPKSGTKAEVVATPPSGGKSARSGATCTVRVGTPERGVVCPARDDAKYSLLPSISGRFRLSWRTYVRAPPTVKGEARKRVG